MLCLAPSIFRLGPQLAPRFSLSCSSNFIGLVSLRGHLRARPRHFFFFFRASHGSAPPTLRTPGMSDSDVPKPTTLTVPPPRPPTQITAFAASDLLRDADGYQDWVLTLCSRMPSDVIDYLKSGVPPTSWPPAYVPLWDHYARASICAAVDPRLVLPGLSQYFGDTHSGHKIWAALRTRYGAVSAVDLLPVISRLFSPDLMPDTADAFLQFRDRFENDSRLLNDSDVTTDSLLASHLLARMPPSLSAWRTTFVNSQGTSRTLPHAAEILDRIYREIKARPIDPLAAATVTATSPQRTPPSPCPNPTCRKMHWLRDCPDTTWAAAFRARKAASGTTSRAHKKGSRTIASPAVTSPTDTERPEPTTFTACLLATPSAFPKSAWLLDSGANRHMANDSTLFSSLRPFTGPHVAGVAGSLPSTGCGSVRLSTSAGPVVATDVLLVPSLPCNLLSVRRLDRLGFTVSFGSGHAAIRNSSGTVVATARAIANDLYALNVAPSTCMPNALLATPHRVSLLTLHRRLAHLPVAQLKNVVQKGLVTGVDWVYSEEEFRSFHCNACLASKAHALPFARSKSIAPGRLALIHVDVAQMPRASFGGHRYMLVIVDDYSRKQWCLLLTYKSDVFHRLRDWILEVENATGDRVKTIRSDNGGEFTLRTFVDFCVAKGIRRELTIPYTPQQNGRVERTNRTIKEGILALLYSAGADTRLWAEAAKYFVHCKNLLPHAGIHGEVPDTRWYGMAPDVSSLRTFGCRAWHCLPSVKRTDLDPKAVPLIFVGLDDHAKAYRLFDPATRKILLSRNVVFRESEFPALQPAANTTTGATPLPVAAEVYPDQVDHSEPLLVASPRSPAPRAAPPAAPPGPAPVASDQGPSPASDQGSPTASDQGSSDSAISTPCPSPRPVVPRPLPAPPSPARSESPDPIDLLPRSSDLASFCLAPEFPDDLDDALHSPPPVAYLASGAAALLNNAPPDSTELIAPARDPPHWRAAMATPQADEWRLAAQAEFDSLSRDFSAFTPIDESLVPADAKILGSRFVFRTKRDQHGQVKSYKGRLVARGDSQRSGIDFDETFAPVAKFTSIRALLALAAAHGYHVHQADIDKAYLHGKLDKPLYIRVPDGIYMPGKVLQLHRSLYGLRQAGRIWNDEIDSALSALGYAATESDHCVYVRTAGDERHYIALYVDDLLMISPSLPEIERTLQGLEQRYGVKRLGEAEYILGIQIRRSDDGSITLSQEQYLKDVLARFGMSDAHPVATPMQPDLRLEVELQPTPFPDRTRYLQAIGSLMYASTGTRPDLAYTVGYLARFSRAPSTAAWGAIKHAFRYVAGTLSHGLRFAHGASPPLVGYSDCNWGACLSSSKSTMGYNFIYAGAAVSWSSRLQSRVADSTCDAEYLGLSHAGKEAIFLRQLFGELGLSSSEPVLIYGDNQGANALTKNPVFHARTRHIRLREHFVRDMVSLGDIVIQYITTSEMTADIFTKALSRDLFARHRGRLGAGQLAPRFSLSCSSNFIGLVSLVRFCGAFIISPVRLRVPTPPSRTATYGAIVKAPRVSPPATNTPTVDERFQIRRARWVDRATKWQQSHLWKDRSTWFSPAPSGVPTSMACFNCGRGGHFSQHCTAERQSPVAVQLSAVADPEVRVPISLERVQTRPLSSVSASMTRPSCPPADPVGRMKEGASSSVDVEIYVVLPMTRPTLRLNAVEDVPSYADAASRMRRYWGPEVVSSRKAERTASPAIVRARNIIAWTLPSGRTLRCLVDSGSEVDLVDQDVVRTDPSFTTSRLTAPLHLRLGTRDKSDRCAVFANALFTSGSLDLGLRAFFICRVTAYDAILGLPFLKDTGMLVGWGVFTVARPGPSQPVAKGTHEWDRAVTVAPICSDHWPRAAQPLLDVVDDPALEDLSESEARTRLAALLEKYSDVFVDSLPMDRLPPYRPVNHEIPLIDPNEKVKPRVYPLADKYRSQWAEHSAKYTPRSLLGFWSDRLCGPGLPPFPKKNSQTARFVIDLRARNSNTAKRFSPIPDMTSVRYEVARSRYRSKFDVAAAFEQVRVIPEHGRSHRFRHGHGHVHVAGDAVR
ncbi:BQ5605_C083g12990 [Microbotryum silenes-dioicae]|uniref:BQ5605_C083g12990 protein n=1 Tax=Microbotryum silenes-dioicae TaxID=796604 RepID=A0A2X0LXA3_9BASI|nr:BQ5605_C083g12990 [Microbotryum silenes-dioicae]